jgi:hypothetical protein
VSLGALFFTEIERNHLRIREQHIKAIVSSISEYNAQKYGWHFVISEESDEQLRRRSALVKYKKYKTIKNNFTCRKKT